MTANESAVGSLDEKACALARVLYQLRQDIDVHRIVSLNASNINQSSKFSAFFGHVHDMALASICIAIPKLFEESKRYELCSIPAIISDLNNFKLTLEDQGVLDDFVQSTSYQLRWESCAQDLKKALKNFRQKHSEDFSDLKIYRDKIGAHMEHGVSLESLPSHEVFEAIFDFGVGVYRVVHDAYNGIGPALMSIPTETSLVAVLDALGYEHILRDFP